MIVCVFVYSVHRGQRSVLDTPELDSRVSRCLSCLTWELGTKQVQQSFLTTNPFPNSLLISHVIRREKLPSTIILKGAKGQHACALELIVFCELVSRKIH